MFMLLSVMWQVPKGMPIMHDEFIPVVVAEVDACRCMKDCSTDCEPMNLVLLDEVNH